MNLLGVLFIIISITCLCAIVVIKLFDLYHQYKEEVYIDKLGVIAYMFNTTTFYYSSRRILSKIKDMDLLNNDNKDINAICTLLKYRMRTRAHKRFMKFYSKITKKE